jgi:hypothetical protein
MGFIPHESNVATHQIPEFCENNHDVADVKENLPCKDGGVVPVSDNIKEAPRVSEVYPDKDKAGHECKEGREKGKSPGLFEFLPSEDINQGGKEETSR